MGEASSRAIVLDLRSRCSVEGNSTPLAPRLGSTEHWSHLAMRLKLHPPGPPPRTEHWSHLAMRLKLHPPGPPPRQARRGEREPRHMRHLSRSPFLAWRGRGPGGRSSPRGREAGGKESRGFHEPVPSASVRGSRAAIWRRRRGASDEVCAEGGDLANDFDKVQAEEHDLADDFAKLPSDLAQLSREFARLAHDLVKVPHAFAVLAHKVVKVPREFAVLAADVVKVPREFA